MGTTTVILSDCVSEDVLQPLIAALLSVATKVALHTGGLCSPERKFCLCQGIRSAGEKSLQLQVCFLLLHCFLCCPVNSAEPCTTQGMPMQVLVRPAPFTIRRFIQGCSKLRCTTADSQQHLGVALSPDVPAAAGLISNFSRPPEICDHSFLSHL